MTYQVQFLRGLRIHGFFEIAMKLDIIPVAKIEKRFMDTLKNENLIKFASKYKLQTLSDQDPGEAVPSFREILNNINYSTIKLPDKPWQIQYKYRNSEGVTNIYLHNEFLTERPSIIFHHGLGRLNPLHLKLFANKILLEKFNLFSVKTAHHDSINELRNKFFNNFTNLSCGICSSVLAIDEIVDTHRNNSDQKISVVGVSMGGSIAALHYFYFNSADYYFPIISYPNFGEIILDKNIKEFVYNYESVSKNKSILNSFRIPKELMNKPKNKIVPILANSDEIINFKKASDFWKGYEMVNFNVGHNTIFVKIEDIRKLILGKVFG
ncbi:hypothetical protein A2685_00610 [Candidatus Woesebacteria bacterium RIFCSPHIGHO2_01_FULL_37_10]|uniref:Peptidase S9 prolyl oligopeptidase catalytic domain-containing protein n=1 Tax=Candidatus Woesebacteria bacterium RIFCSPHIGHO2_01_FULL_37_10 TaxID=1802489 RepID=A0A1F7XWS7_9BACT|nr:MAG: hypothetical protein A2685_00610 [Candidatus Woesebacteria bacterium RIFCSPHIGHO2_01_FULL_37_10]